MKLLLSILALPLLLLAACKKDSSSSSGSCANTPCTADFATLQVCLRNGANSPITVDSVRTLLTNGTRVPIADNGGLPAPGCYGVVNDNWVQGHENTHTTMRFQAFRNGQILIDTPYVIGTDCCHISKISGPDEIAAR